MRTATLATIRAQPGGIPGERAVVGATRLIPVFLPGYVLVWGDVAILGARHAVPLLASARAIIPANFV